MGREAEVGKKEEGGETLPSSELGAQSSSSTFSQEPLGCSQEDSPVFWLNQYILPSASLHGRASEEMVMRVTRRSRRDEEQERSGQTQTRAWRVLLPCMRMELGSCSLRGLRTVQNTLQGWQAHAQRNGQPCARRGGATHSWGSWVQARSSGSSHTVSPVTTL